MRLTRRGAFLGAAAAAAFPAVARAEDQKALNAHALQGSLETVQALVVAYEAIANGGLLARPAETTFRSFLDQEREHAAAIGDALDQMGARQPAPPRRAEIRGLSSLRSQRQAVGLALGLERRALAAHYAAARYLKDANALHTLASIMGCDGQHATVLRRLAGLPAVPRAFESGAA